MLNKLKNILLTISIIFMVSHPFSSAMAEEPVQHLQVEDVVTLEEAKQVFAETTAELRTKETLDATELHEIHMITYSLEKAIAYFVENMTGEKQTDATKMAEIVELIHLGSENNRVAETKLNLQSYFNMADTFSENL